MSKPKLFDFSRYVDMHHTYHVLTADKPSAVSNPSDLTPYQARLDSPTGLSNLDIKIEDIITDMWNREDVRDGVNIKYPHVDKAQYYHPEARCLCCGKSLSWDDDSIHIHYVDNDASNKMLTNMMPLCSDCAKRYESKNIYTATVCKKFKFDAAHYLPYHDGKCKQFHGHTYHLEIEVKNAVLSNTGMVIDFSKLKNAVQTNIIDTLDHSIINEYIPYPTAEMMVLWIWENLSIDIKGLHSIKLYETDGSYAKIYAEDIKEVVQRFEYPFRNKEEVDLNESL